ncbi:MAG: S41 family peptidase [Candidatus Palauibacterales bacterium]|nr:S41 family peptidase [Candidatus Palauibacterales bacterium]MDP2528475.1 S41 family peptidase [Candidatus Palauibacterales bacterium]MDP2582998.1 S41 family peptidase [Candidatus Palauibacterales bacterium]
MNHRRSLVLSTAFLLAGSLPAAAAPPGPAAGPVASPGAATASGSRTAPDSADEPGYYRYPALHDSTIVFTAEGDLWSVGIHGGEARRLTTGLREERDAAFSPDGRTLAFTASYEGPTEVYTMPVAGGVPVRRSWDGGGATVVGWTPDGRVLYTTSHYSTLPNAQLVALDTATQERTVLPLAQASDGVYGRSGKDLYFTRLPFQGSHTDRYEGGSVQQLWKYETGAKEATPLTADYPGTSKAPMLWQGRVVFASDRDGVMNLWSMDERGGDLKELTHHRVYNLESPSLSDGHVVYQYGADLHVLDLASGQDRTVPIRLASDFDQLRPHWVHDPMDYLTAVHLSPAGDRVVLTARGQLFVAPAGQGRFVEATRTNSVRYRRARFAPGGDSLVALSDSTGEVEVWKLPANGVGQPRQLTHDGTVMRWDAVPSPDGRRIAHYDKDHRLWLLDTSTGRSQEIAHSTYGDFGELAWSPDSRWLAYVEPLENGFARIVLYGVDDGSTTPVTTTRYSSYSPAWSRDGKWLYLLSDRHFVSSVGSPWGARQPEPYFTRTTKIYALALEPGTRSPFRPDDELESPPKASSGHGAKPGRGEAGEGKGGSDTTSAPPSVRIQLQGLSGRLEEVPVPPGNYNDLSAGEGTLYWLSSEDGPERTRKLEALEVTNHEPRPATLVEGVRSYELSADGKKILVRKGDDLYVFGAGPKAPAKLADDQVDLGDWTLQVDPRREYMEMFREAWRLHRDYFYDPGMHGVDWPAMEEKYSPLARRVTDREELSDVIGQMVAELSALHTFVVGGDMRPGQDSIQVASLGARLERDPKAGGYRVEHIYRADPDLPDQLSPLARPGVDVRAGDVITAIDGVSTLSVSDYRALLRHKAGKQTLLSIRPAAGGAERGTIVTPIGEREASSLRYDEWEYTRRLEVDSLSHDSIGYVHLRAMGSSDIAAWERQFYPVFGRQALIVDVRNNRGGNIDSWILEKLMRRSWMYFKPRKEAPRWNMQEAFRGPMIALINEHTASDGEAFSAGFRRLGLGKLLGTRTWGGEIWLSFDNVLVDGGIASAAEMGVYGPKGQWLIEGHGVDPDIDVDNAPHQTFEGHDAQLRAAVQELRKEMREHPNPVPPAPAYPDKSAAGNGKKGGG